MSSETRIKPNAAQLRVLMAEHNLRANDIAEKLGRSTATVHAWLTESNIRDVPKDTIKLLKIVCLSEKKT